MTRPTFEKFRQKALKKPAVQKEYGALESVYELRKNLIALRKEAGLTQEELAEILHTKKSNISRLENIGTTASPRLSTIESYAQAMGYKVRISFVPDATP